MKWSDEELAALRMENGFYLRSESMTRLEVFSDTAYAFALTMLVVSVGSIPESHEELILALKNVPAFLLSFTQIVAFWWAHRVWSQRYGLQTVGATVLTLAMIFVILVFVYPLRLIYAEFCHYITGGWLPSEFNIVTRSQIADLFVIYGLAFFCLTVILALLYVNAYRNRADLRLTGVELIRTKKMAAIFFTQAVFGILSALFALLTPEHVGVFAGFIYVGLGIVTPLVAMQFEKKLKRHQSSPQTA